jgi:TolB protein
MRRKRTLVLLLIGLILFSVMAGSIGARPAKKAWRIVLTSDREGDSEVYSMNADGTRARRLTFSRGFDGGGPPSPDGRKILYYSRAAWDGHRRGHKGDVFVMNADGSGKRDLTRNPAFDVPGSWSPDGQKITFVSDRDGNNELYVMNANGTAQRNLAPNPSSQEWGGAWTRDGRTIMFVSDRSGNWEIYSMNADGTKPRNLTRNPANDAGISGLIGFALSPNGRKIAFASTRDTRDEQNPDMYVMNADGTGVRRLTRTPWVEAPFTWSPDDRKLAFFRFPVKPRWAFFVMKADGSGVRKVNWSLPRRKP